MYICNFIPPKNIKVRYIPHDRDNDKLLVLKFHLKDEFKKLGLSSGRKFRMVNCVKNI